MSALGKMFTFKKGEKPVTAGEAIQKLREVEEMLKKRQEFLEAKTEKELAVARQNRTKNKKVALQALKRKKMYEKHLQQIDGTLSTIEIQREALESANTNTAVLKSMDEAAKAMKSAHHNMDVDKVQDMIDDIAEQQEVAKEISDVISNPVAFDQDTDVDELEKELEELMAESLASEFSKLGPTTSDELPTLPDVPSSSKLKPARRIPADDDGDMKTLASWAS